MSSSHCAALLLSCASWLLHCLSSRHPLVLLSCRPLVLLLFFHCATLLLSHLNGWLLRHLLLHLPLIILSLRCSCRLALSGCCIASHHRAALLSCHLLVLSSSSHCAALLLSHLTGWLLRCLLLHRPLVVLSLRCSFVLLCRLVVALILVAPPSHPLVVPPTRPLVVLYLKLVKPGFLDPFDATFMVLQERSSRMSPVWPLVHARWSRRWDQTSSMNRMLLTSPCLAQLYSSPDMSSGSAS